MKSYIVLAAVGALSLSVVNAHADDQSRLVLARQFVQSAHLADSMRHVLPIIMQNLKPTMTAQMGGNEKFRDVFIARFMQQADSQVDKFMDTAAQIYAQQFSEDDLKNMIAFYDSPTGKDLVAKTPAMQLQMSNAGRQWGIMIAGEAMQQYAKELADAQAQGGSLSAQTPAPTTPLPAPAAGGAPAPKP